MGSDEQIDWTRRGKGGETLSVGHLVERDGKRFAGVHLLVELYEATRLDELTYVDEVLRRCVAASGATLLHIYLHHFSENSGVSGVAILAESHISIHSWPEHGYAALDLFMCGHADPAAALPVLESAFSPGRMKVTEHLRGEELGQ